MAKNLIPEELDALIQEFLTDGVLTDKERQVILRKAESLGCDRDEVDLYLDAEVQKIDQATDAAARKQKGKTCPYCGGSIPQLTDKCPHCGEIITPEANKDLQEILDNLEAALVDLKSAKDIKRSKATIERFARKAKLYYSNNPKLKSLLVEIETESALAEKRAKSYARNQAITDFIKKRPKTLGCLGFIVISFVFMAIAEYFSTKESEASAERNAARREEIRHALDAGDLENALTLYNKYGGASEYKSLLGKDLAKAFIAQGDLDKAFEVTGNNPEDTYIQEEMESAFIAKEDYEKAIKISSTYYADGAYRILCLCLEKMRAKQSQQKLKSFIDLHLYLFDESDKEKYRERLYEFVGLKYTPSQSSMKEEVAKQAKAEEEKKKDEEIAQEKINQVENATQVPETN
ncbi:MAG: zinc ribbon domain-containing protein [Bacteroidaceae bacterium]|nr:zinc ribbon domain-containing protein [Bacteroidaceae bacterium]